MGEPSAADTTATPDRRASEADSASIGRRRACGCWSPLRATGRRSWRSDGPGRRGGERLVRARRSAIDVPVLARGLSPASARIVPGARRASRSGSRPLRSRARAGVLADPGRRPARGRRSLDRARRLPPPSRRPGRVSSSSHPGAPRSRAHADRLTRHHHRGWRAATVSTERSSRSAGRRSR